MTTVILPVLGEALPIVALIAAVVLLGGPFDRVLSRWADAARRQSPEGRQQRDRHIKQLERDLGIGTEARR